MVGGVPPRIGPGEIGEPSLSHGVSETRKTSTPDELAEVTGTPSSTSGVPKEASHAAALNQGLGLKACLDALKAKGA